MLQLAAVVVLTGCTKINPLYCEQNDDCASASCDTAARECDPVQVCTTSGDCVAPGAPVCDQALGYCAPCTTVGAEPECQAFDSNLSFCADSGACVECLEDATCAAATPICTGNACQRCASSTECQRLGTGADICAPSGECVACLNHSDCSASSEVCDRATNSCADEQDVVFVDDAVGDDVGGCGGKTLPCKTISFALALSAAPFVRVRSGDYTGNLNLSGVTVTLVGPSASFVAVASGQPAIDVSAGATVTVEGMTIRGATGSGTPVGIRCADSGTTLTLRDARIALNESNGIRSVGCAVRMFGGSVDSNNDIGISVINGSLVINGAEIYNNDDGGIHLLSVEYDIINTYLVQNGRAGAGGSDIGGIRADNAAEMRPQRFAFNTVADNSVREGAVSSGVHCDASGMASPVLTSNIVYGNVGVMDQISGSCPWRYSNIEDYEGAGSNNNIDEPPLFVDEMERNYHLRTDSPCIDSGETLSDVILDWDQQQRGAGGGYDMGADEVIP